MKKFLNLIIPALLLSSCGGENIPNKSDNQTIDTGSGNVLVAYFSVTNNTKKLAEYAQKHLNSDIFEIVPKQKYTSEDIAYSTDCRANREQNDEAARPEILYTIEDISKYDTIVLGYPIWWGQAPKILYTFVESYNLEGKTILPFCTSGSSPLGTSATNLAKSASKATWLEGARFAANTSEETFTTWLDQYIKEDIKMKLLIDGKEIKVKWETNTSTKALKELAKSTLTINMHKYGDFEQTGEIGHTIVRNDRSINTVPGDIVLYQGNQISVFYNENSYSYTMLGHIDLNKNELNTLLNKDSIVFTLKGE